MLDNAKHFKFVKYLKNNFSSTKYKIIFFNTFILNLLDKTENNIRWVILLVGCRFKSNCPLMGPGTMGGMSSMGIFLSSKES